MIHRDLEVYKNSLDLVVKVYEKIKYFLLMENLV